MTLTIFKSGKYRPCLGLGVLLLSACSPFGNPVGNTVGNTVGSTETQTPLSCDQTPVLMIVTGVTHDAARMGAYAKALSDSGLYKDVNGYYLNNPRPLAQIEGELPDDHVALVVRFPSQQAVEAFWNSKTYQETIKPMRQNPSAGSYTVTLYEETPVPAYMDGKVTSPDYSSDIACQETYTISSD